MEVDLVKPAVVMSPEEEECVTPTERGSRIPLLTVCPPAPRKKPAVFERQKRRESSPPNKDKEKEKKYSFDEAALQLLFAFRTKKKTKEADDVSDSDFSKS